MKKFLLCSASVLAITVATSQVQAQEATAASSWDGFYFGGHMGAGYVLGELAHGSDDYAFTKGGMLGGLQLGYNQDGGGFIWGVEADVSFADLQRQNAAHMIGADGMSSIRARLGAEIGNGALAYLTVGAGALWGTSQSSDGDGGDYVVWRPVLGAGIEAPLNEHLTIKAEGLAFLGSDSPSGVSDPNRLKDVFTARLGINYHLNGTNYGRMAGAGEGSWNGWYFGAHLGAAKVSGELADGSDDYTYKRGGGSGGLQLGFNQETNGYIWGVEADASFADLQMASERHNMGPDGMASFRGKIGKDIGNGTIAYLTGGAGVLWGISNSSDGILSSGYAVWRPVVGAGIEAPLNENFTVKAEGLAFIGRDRPTPPSDPNVIDDVFVARLGINYHLNGTTYGSAAANRSDPANSSWDGVYLGAHLGSAVMSGEFAIGSDDFSVSKAGMLGGLQLGYNQEIRGYIWGLEGDFGFVDLTRRQQYIHQLNVSTMATVRGRIGMEVSGGAFAYLTAGAGALSGTNQSSDADGDTYWVWRPVVGAGLEAPINEFLTFKAEGLAFIGSDKPSGVSDPNRLDDVFVTRLGLNYHFDGTTYGKVADNVADPLNGYYFGAHLGGAYASGELARGSDDYSFTKAGGLAGLQLGYNQESHGYIWGIEGDVSLADMDFTVFGHGIAADAMATLRGRLGVAIDSRNSFAYVTAGAGLLMGTTTSSDGTFNNGFAVVRPVVGFGVETPLNDRFTVKAEGLAFIGSDSPSGPSDSNTLDDIFSARLGINYHM